MSVAIEIFGVKKAFRRRERESGAPWWRREWKDRVALHEMDLVIEAGGVTGILGPNGSGKSTLIRILGTLLTPDAGRATVFGWDVVEEPLSVRRHVNRVSVEAAFFKELDPRSKKEVQALLQMLRAEREVTVLLCTHDMDEAAQLCDRVLMMDAGRVLADGTPEELCRRYSVDGSIAKGSPRTQGEASEFVGATLEDVFMRLSGKSLELDGEEE